MAIVTEEQEKETQIALLRKIAEGTITSDLWCINTAKDLLFTYKRYTLSEKQWRLVKNLWTIAEGKEIERKKAEKLAKELPPIPPGTKVHVKGTIEILKNKHNSFGAEVLKCMVKSDTGRKIWVTCKGGEKGDKVEFVCGIFNHVSDDPLFFIGHRPTKWKVIK